MQVYLPSHSPEAKREFVGEKGSFQLNLKLAPPYTTHMRGFLTDKVALTGLFEHLGLPTTRVQAVFAKYRTLGTMPVLRDAAAIARFLTDEARYPLFGKPVRGYQAIGSVRLEDCDRTQGMVTYSNGRSVPVADLAAEIVAKHEEGFVFQDVVVQHREITERIGSAVGTVRVVTVVEDETPRPLYAVWKIPSPKAMSDNFWQSGSMLAALDLATGEILQVRRGTGPATEWIDAHPVSGKALKDWRLPEWQSVLDLAVAVHGVVPINGILGWDIAITDAGALCIECNENTAHTLYQLANGRGVMNADFNPVFDRVIARNARLLAEFKAKEAAYEASH